MGWTYMHREKGTSHKDFFADLFNSEKSYVADCASKNGVAYIAYATPKGVAAVICLLGMAPHDDFNFGYKDMDESMGPNACDCPERILARLSPLEDLYEEGTKSYEYAQSWRAACQANIDARKAKPKVSSGDRVRFKRPFEFTNGTRASEFIFVKGSTFKDSGGYGRYRIRRWRDHGYEVIK